MDERLKFISEYLKQEQSMSALCKFFNISRKTGYKLVHRYVMEGYYGLYDRSRSPHHNPYAVSGDIISAILSLRNRYPRWGSRKLRAWLCRNCSGIEWPSVSTIGRILLRHGKIIPRRQSRRTPPYTRPFNDCRAPNDVWCADFKGWFRTGDRARCEPLTVTDSYSRYALACRALPYTTQAVIRPLFESLFREYGLPWAIRTDNGTPFASTALGGLSRLAVWWIKLGIIPERIEPGHPEQNGRHERFHRTLKEESITPPKATLEEQQAAFDRFCFEYNRERPHEALSDKTPASVYKTSPRPYPSRMPQITYPDHMVIRKVRPSGSVRWHGQELYISETVIGEPIAFEQIDEFNYQIYFGPVKLAVYDNKKKKIIKPNITRRKTR
jgi:transposase InsO family protein